jgi:hypothetical protein
VQPQQLVAKQLVLQVTLQPEPLQSVQKVLPLHLEQQPLVPASLVPALMPHQHRFGAQGVRFGPVSQSQFGHLMAPKPWRT